MNTKLAELSAKAAQITSAHDQMDVLDELRELAGDQDPILYLLSEMQNLQGHLTIRSVYDRPITRMTSRDVDVRLDGMKLPPWYDLKLSIGAQDVVRVELSFYATKVDIDVKALTMLQMLAQRNDT